jgi:uncharacterized protein YggE
MGIVGIVLISIFGNITTTNQQDYTLIKNATEAAMNDAIDRASQRAGFYLCFERNVNKNSNGQYEFQSKDDYRIVRKANNRILNLKDARGGECDYLQGEIIINRDVFVESFLRRMSENINNNKSYQVTVQDVIEYPPKVSIRIDTFNTHNATGSTTVTFTEGDFTIQNQVDAIFEEK